MVNGIFQPLRRRWSEEDGGGGGEEEETGCSLPPSVCCEEKLQLYNNNNFKQIQKPGSGVVCVCTGTISNNLQINKII